ncbi:hypothetical protein ANO11243_057970 [Dothideomycetidae sp. 11243]|nr:hypothetical protein ANO11243_057970 [fungal sp. No.11243]
MLDAVRRNNSQGTLPATQPEELQATVDAVPPDNSQGTLPQPLPDDVLDWADHVSREEYQALFGGSLPEESQGTDPPLPPEDSQGTSLPLPPDDVQGTSLPPARHWMDLLSEEGRAACGGPALPETQPAPEAETFWAA